MVDALTKLVAEHAKDVVFAVLVWIGISTLADALPEPKGNGLYRFVHMFLHGLSGNLKTSAISFLRLIHVMPPETPPAKG